MSSVLPYDVTKLAGAATRVLYAPSTVTIPAVPNDIFDQESPYTPKTGWLEAGATSGPTQASRNLTLGGYTIEQTTTTLLEEPTNVVYTVQIPFAELRPEILQIVNEAPAIDAVTAVTGVTGTSGASAGSRVPFGTILDLTNYRIAFVCMKSKQQGIVMERSGKKRGRFLVYVAYNCTIAGENVQSGFAKGTLASATVTFTLYPDPSISTSGEEYGYWFDEAAGTIH